MDSADFNLVQCVHEAWVLLIHPLVSNVCASSTPADSIGFFDSLLPSIPFGHFDLCKTFMTVCSVCKPNEIITNSCAVPSTSCFMWMVCKIVGVAVYPLFCRMLLPGFVQNTIHLVFPGILLESKWCNHTIVLTQLLLGRVLILS